jgi:hypothetical protein
MGSLHIDKDGCEGDIKVRGVEWRLIVEEKKKHRPVRSMDQGTDSEITLCSVLTNPYCRIPNKLSLSLRTSPCCGQSSLWRFLLSIPNFYVLLLTIQLYIFARRKSRDFYHDAITMLLPYTRSCKPSVVSSTTSVASHF